MTTESGHDTNSSCFESGLRPITLRVFKEEKKGKKDYDALADAIIQKVGGQGNVSHLEHCSTR